MEVYYEKIIIGIMMSAALSVTMLAGCAKEAEPVGEPDPEVTEEVAAPEPEY